MKVKKILALTLAMVMVLSSISVMNIFADEAQAVNYAWIEAENASPDTGVGFGSISGEAGSTFQTLSGLKALRVNTGTNTNIGINFNFSVDKAQSYDVFVHGTYEENSAWMSAISMHVDSAKCDITNLGAEGWIIKGSSGYNFQIGWQKVTADLTAGSHTFRWQIDGPGSNASANKAVLDAIVVLPAGSGFEPTKLETVDSAFPVKNSIDYQLCTLLTGYDLSNITGDITLPATTPDGTAVTWTTSDEDVISTTGAVTKTSSEQTAALTASVTVDDVPYTKTFDVTIPGETVASAVNCAWIEGESGTENPTSNIGKISGDEGTTYDTVSGNAAYRVNSGTETGIGLDYTFSVEKAQSYDIFVRGTYEIVNAWTSQISMHVDGTASEITNIGSEPGWIIKGSKYNFQAGWQKVTKELSTGEHTFRWQVDGVGTSASANLAIIDVVVVLPTGVGFEPTFLETQDSPFPVKNEVDYDLCTLLTAYDLTSLKEDITLANTTPAGNGVTWETSDSSVIALDGTVTRSEDETKTVTLTASTTVDGVDYSKAFTVTVPKLGDYIVDSFAITKADGSTIDALSEGLAIKASAEVTSAKAGTIKIILAHYRADKSIVDFSIEPCTLTAEVPGDALAEYTVTDYEAGDFVKAFIWSDFETLVPITASISK